MTYCSCYSSGHFLFAEMSEYTICLMSYTCLDSANAHKCTKSLVNYLFALSHQLVMYTTCCYNAVLHFASSIHEGYPSIHLICYLSHTAYIRYAHILCHACIVGIVYHIIVEMLLSVHKNVGHSIGSRYMYISNHG